MRFDVLEVFFLFKLKEKENLNSEQHDESNIGLRFAFSLSEA